MANVFLTTWENITKEIETIRLPVKDPKSERGVSMDNFPIIYPHRVLTYLFDHVGLDIPDEDVRAYWKHARQVGEPWAVGNPSSDHHVPVGLHGDSARLWTVHQFEKHVGVFMNLVLWRPRSIRHSRFLIFSIPQEKVWKNRTFNRVWERLAWSFNACWEGFNPCQGPRGIPLRGKHLERAGLPITKGGHKFTITVYRGDWEWHCHTWRPRASWQGVSMCMKCPAQSRGDAGLLYYNLGSCVEDGCRWVQEEYSLAGFIAKSLKDRNLCGLPVAFHHIFCVC